MRAYFPSPNITRPMGASGQAIRITTATNVCSDDAYTVQFYGPESEWTATLTLYFTDDDADDFIEKFAAARMERIRKQEETYEALHAKFGGTWDNAALHSDALADRTDPDNDFPEVPVYTDDDAPDE